MDDPNSFKPSPSLILIASRELARAHPEFSPEEVEKRARWLSDKGIGLDANGQLFISVAGLGPARQAGLIAGAEGPGADDRSAREKERDKWRAVEEGHAKRLAAAREPPQPSALGLAVKKAFEEAVSRDPLLRSGRGYKLRRSQLRTELLAAALQKKAEGT